MTCWSRVAPQEAMQMTWKRPSPLCRYQMKLNLAKCAFGVMSSKFLRFMVSHRGIEANPEKIQPIRQMGAQKAVKEVQRLMGRLAALIQFIFKLVEQCLPFFKTLKKLKDFQQHDDCKKAFENLKDYLCTPSLSKPKAREELYLYLAVSPSAISSVLVHEKDRVQKPVYYVS